MRFRSVWDNLPPRTRKITAGIVGGIVLAVGIVMIPYPGPGWVVVFVGLSILATEFTWARGVYEWLHARYEWWQQWLERQPLLLKGVLGFLTVLLVVVTIWLMNGYGLVDDWFHLGLGWAHSPLVQ